MRLMLTVTGRMHHSYGSVSNDVSSNLNMPTNKCQYQKVEYLEILYFGRIFFFLFLYFECYLFYISPTNSNDHCCVIYKRSISILLGSVSFKLSFLLLQQHEQLIRYSTKVEYGFKSLVLQCI